MKYKVKITSTDMKYRAKITAIVAWVEEHYNGYILRDVTDTYIDVDSEEECISLEKINKAAREFRLMKFQHIDNYL